MIQAIVVDDDEVGDFDDSSDPEPLDDDADGDESDDSDVQVVYPDGKGGFKGRYQSVSDDEYEEPSSEPEDEPSRYAIKQPKAKVDTAQPKEAGELDTDDDDDPGATAKIVKKGDAASRQAQGKRNRDFWAAKGGAALPDSDLDYDFHIE